MPQVVPPIKSGYTPRETFLTPDQFMALSRNLIVSRTNPKPATIAHEDDRRIKRTLCLLLAGLAACRKGELDLRRRERDPGTAQTPPDIAALKAHQLDTAARLVPGLR